MDRTETMVQLTEELVDELDRVVVNEGRSRSAATRTATAEQLENERRDEKVRRWTDGYRRIPPGHPR